MPTESAPATSYSKQVWKRPSVKPSRVYAGNPKNEPSSNQNAKVQKDAPRRGEFRTALGIQNAQLKVPNDPSAKFGYGTFWF